MSEIIAAYVRYYCEHRIWDNLTYGGIKIFKVPFDLWIMQELLFRLKPDLLVETGTYQGGSALFYAHLFDAIGSGEVLTIDITNFDNLPQHPRITYLRGDSVEALIVNRVTSVALDKQTVWVALDADHSKSHVLTELNLYAPLVTLGGYLVVEDTFMDRSGYVLHEELKDAGPEAAVAEFLSENPNFVVDRTVEKFGVSFMPGGFLRRMGEG